MLQLRVGPQGVIGRRGEPCWPGRAREPDAARRPAARPAQGRRRPWWRPAGAGLPLLAAEPSGLPGLGRVGVAAVVTGQVGGTTHAGSHANPPSPSPRRQAADGCAPAALAASPERTCARLHEAWPLAPQRPSRHPRLRSGSGRTCPEEGHVFCSLEAPHRGAAWMRPPAASGGTPPDLHTVRDPVAASQQSRGAGASGTGRPGPRPPRRPSARGARARPTFAAGAAGARTGGSAPALCVCAGRARRRARGQGR